MYFLALHPKHQFSPMAVFSDDPRKVVNDILDTSEKCKAATRDFTLEACDVFCLDPGGMYNTKEPQKEFEVDGHKFEIQLTKIPDVLWLTDPDLYNRERIPGYIRFRNFGQNAIMPKALLLRLREKLVEFSKTDEAMHAEISDFELREKLSQHPGIKLNLNIPRENP